MARTNTRTRYSRGCRALHRARSGRPHRARSAGSNSTANWDRSPSPVPRLVDLAKLIGKIVRVVGRVPPGCDVAQSAARPAPARPDDVELVVEDEEVPGRTALRVSF